VPSLVLLAECRHGIQADLVIETPVDPSYDCLSLELNLSAFLAMVEFGPLGFIL
jgi:hypothetical protein